MPKYIAKASGGICHCDCDFTVATHRGQLDDPWCGCGWLLSCIHCRRAFTFGKVIELPTSYDTAARLDFKAYSGIRHSHDETVHWREVMRELTSPLRIGQTVVYFDGHFIPLHRTNVVFEGLYARHRFTFLPHLSARKSPDALYAQLANPSYWIERRLPDIIILAGPNGAGKTTFATEYLNSYARELQFVNADEIASEIASSGSNGENVDLQAGKVMLSRLNELEQTRSPFMFETTLASLSYLPKIRRWREAGFRVRLIYLKLPDVETSLARVRRRVLAGGHDIPEDVVMRRFSKSLEYLETKYKLAVDEWYVWDSLEGDAHLAASWDD